MSQKYKQHDPEVRGASDAQLVAHGYTDSNGDASDGALHLALFDEVRKLEVSERGKRSATAMTTGSLMERLLPNVPLDYATQPDPELAEAVHGALYSKINRALALSANGTVQKLLLAEGLVLCHTKTLRDPALAVYVTSNRKLVEADAFNPSRMKAEGALRHAATQASAFAQALGEEDFFDRVRKRAQRAAVTAGDNAWQLALGVGDNGDTNGPDPAVTPEPTAAEEVSA